MHFTEEELKKRWQQYRSEFIRRVRDRGAEPPSDDVIAEYADGAFACDLAAGHYLIEKVKSRQRAA